MAKTRRERERKRISARDRSAKRQTGFTSKVIRLPEGFGFFSIDKAGVKSINIIPFVTGQGNPFCDPGEVYYERTFYTHPRIGASGDSYVCPKKTAGKRCPICEHRTELTKQEDADEEVIKSLSPKERQLWIVQDRANLDKGLQIWDVSYHLFGKALDARVKNSDEDDGYDFFYDLEDGLLLKVGMEEKTWSGNTFYDCVSIDFKPRKEALDPDLLEEAPCLDDLLIIPTYDELKAVYLQTEDLDDEEEETRKPSRKRPVADDEDTDDDLDDEDDDEEEVVKPVKSKAKPAKSPPKSKPPVEVDDEDEDDDDFDDGDLDDEEEECVDEDDDDASCAPRDRNCSDKEGKCVACKGSCKNSKGGKCMACKGTGRKTEPADPAPAKATKPTKAKAAPVVEDDEEDDEEETPKVKTKAKEVKKTAPSNGKVKSPIVEEDDDDDWDEGWDD